MALKNIAVNVSGPRVTAASFDTQSTLASDVATAISTATTANAAAGAKADVSAELALITVALNAMTANQLSGAVVVTIDTSLVTTKTMLRKLLDEAYRHFADSQSFLT